MSFDDDVLGKADDIDKLTEFREAFMRHFALKDLKEAQKFSVYCNLIMQVYFKCEQSMTSNQKERFKKRLENCLSRAAEETGAGSMSCAERFARFLEVKLETGTYKIYELLSEVCCRMDLSEYLDDPLFR